MAEDESSRAAAGRTVESGGTAAGAADEAADDGGSIQWLFLLGLLVFLAGLVGFLADLATGHDVVRTLVANAAGAVILVAWAGLDSYRDPDSGVVTLGGAVGTGLILVGLYLLIAGVVVAATSVIHDRLVVGLAMAAGGVPLVLGGFVAYPIAGLPGDADAAGDHAGEPPAADDAEAATDPEAAPVGDEAAEATALEEAAEGEDAADREEPEDPDRA